MHLTIRADTEHGQGHVKRCEALADAWRDRGGTVTWDKGQPHVIDPDTWIVLDGYEFTEDDQKKTKGLGARLLVIDDNAHLPKYHADIVLNHNPYGKQVKYKVEKDTKLLLGPEYALIRREFRDYPLYRTIPPVAQNILVVLGSGATDELQTTVRRALAQLECEYRIADAVTPLPDLMAWADLYLGAAGVTAVEAAFMGLPQVLIVTADNQAHNADALNLAGCAWNLGEAAGVTVQIVLSATAWAQRDETLRRIASENGRKLIDGKGTNRVVEVMLEG